MVVYNQLCTTNHINQHPISKIKSPLLTNNHERHNHAWYGRQHDDGRDAQPLGVADGDDDAHHLLLGQRRGVSLLWLARNQQIRDVRAIAHLHLRPRFYGRVALSQHFHQTGTYVKHKKLNAPIKTKLSGVVQNFLE